MSLNELKEEIEKLTNDYQIQILDILHKIPYLKLNENENGIFINIGLLEKPDIDIIWNKIKSIKDTEKALATPNTI